MATSQMSSTRAESILAQIETALFHVRRVWAKPEIMRKLREQDPSGRPVQTSSLLVVHAVAGLPADVTVGAVAERLEIDPSTASRLVGHAIDAGLVSRRPSPTDARRANLGLTDAGSRASSTSASTSSFVDGSMFGAGSRARRRTAGCFFANPAGVAGGCGLPP